MKGIHLIAIAFLASWTVISAKLPTIFEAENECPVVDPCPPKLIRHETDCTKYYECKYGQKQLHSCGYGLYFSKSWRGCVNRQISDCPEITPPPLPPPTSPPRDCINNGDLLEHECECTKFYECIHGRKALRDCPIGQHFDSSSRTCIQGNCNDPTPPPICVDGEYLPHECQCQKYYFCKGGQKALRECEEGTHFDNKTLKCVPPGNCDIPLICENGNTKKHDCDCERYYKCYNNEWLLECCQNGDHFSERERRCMNPIYAGCDPNFEPGACSKSSPSRWPHECDCRLYYQCENGKKKIYDCTWGYYFDNNNLRCDIARNVKNCVNDWDNWV